MFERVPGFQRCQNAGANGGPSRSGEPLTLRGGWALTPSRSTPSIMNNMNDMNEMSDSDDIDDMNGRFERHKRNIYIYVFVYLYILLSLYKKLFICFIYL